MSIESHPNGGPPEEIWQSFCDDETHAVAAAAEVLEEFGQCDSPSYFPEQLVDSPLPQDLTVFASEGQPEPEGDDKLLGIMCTAIAGQKLWDKEAAMGHAPVVHSRELLAHLGVALDENNVQLVHRSRRLAYKLVGVKFPLHASRISAHFESSLPEEVDWGGLVGAAIRDVYAEPSTRKILEACLPLLCNDASNEAELALARAVASITFFEIKHWVDYIEQQQALQARLRVWRQDGHDQPGAAA